MENLILLLCCLSPVLGNVWPAHLPHYLTSEPKIVDLSSMPGDCDYCALGDPNNTFCQPFRGFSNKCRRVFSSGVTEDEKQEILDLHNKYRRNIANGAESRMVESPASNMMELVWDEELARGAQMWANQCDFTHDSNDVCRFRVGQNIYIAGAVGEPVTDWSKVIQGWYQEVGYFSNDLDRFKDGRRTGHFTQMIWATTEYLGCGRIAHQGYLGRSRFNTGYYVCNYGPSGNLIGDLVFTVGPACSNCPLDTQCKGGICSKLSKYMDTDNSTFSNSSVTTSSNSSVTTSSTSEVTITSAPQIYKDLTNWESLHTLWLGRLSIPLTVDITDYTIVMETDLPLTSLTFWEGTITGSGSSFTLQSPSYFSGKTETGDILELGFTASLEGSEQPAFTLFEFNGVALDLTTETTTEQLTTTTEQLTTTTEQLTTTTEQLTTTTELVTTTAVQESNSSGSCLNTKILYNQGQVTAYGTGGTGGHCGFTELPSDLAKKYFVAISSEDPEGWSDGIYCGSCVRLRYTDGKELTGYIHDSCPSCPKYHWDLSDYMYLDLTSETGVGIKDISQAEIVECPDDIVSGNMKVKVKDGSNPWWAAYQVTNTKNPINGMSMSTDGGLTWVTMDGPGGSAPSGFWFMKPDPLILNSDNGMENYKIRVESDTGDIIVDMVGVVASSETDAGTNNAVGVDCGGQGGQETTAELATTTTAATETTTAGTETTTAGTTVTTATSVTTTAGPVTTTAGPITTTAGPITTTAGPITTTGGSSQCSSQNHDYSEVLRLSLLFYEAQRSGDLPEGNRVPWRGDSSLDDKGNNGEDLTGGYHDAGDYVKFGFPMAGAMTILSYGGISYSTGYQAAGQMDYLKAAVKWGTDYLIKAHVSTEEFYCQVGNGNTDHAYPGRPETMTVSRPAYSLTSSSPGSDCAGESAAALASASILFASSDPDYSAELLVHAEQLFSFADTYKGIYSNSISDASAFYSSNSYEDELIWAAAWLYKATGDTSYLTKAEEMYAARSQTWTSWSFDWTDKMAGVQLLLFELTGKQSYGNDVEQFCDAAMAVERSPGGQTFRAQWGSNRYAANFAFICLGAANAGIQTETYTEYAASQVDYMLGDNPSNYSYVVGYGDSFPQQPHHKASACASPPATCDWGTFNDISQDNPHQLDGALVGGPSAANDYYKDDRTDYIMAEVTLDYNAGFQSTVAGLKALACTQ